MAKELTDLKEEVAGKLKQLAASASQKVTDEYSGLVESVQAKLDHETAVTQGWERRVRQPMRLDSFP